jgi:hypothetical protein
VGGGGPGICIKGETSVSNITANIGFRVQDYGKCGGHFFTGIFVLQIITKHKNIPMYLHDQSQTSEQVKTPET